MITKSRFPLMTTLLLAVLVVTIGSPAMAQDSRRAPVHPWVLDHTANGASAEFLVILKDQADLSPAKLLPNKAARGRFVRDALWQTAQRSQAGLRSWLEARGISYRPFYIVNALLIRGDRTLVEELSRRPDVDRIEGNPVIQNDLPHPTAADRADAPNGVEWGIARTHAPDVWAMGFTGQGVVVGGQDTGVDWTHPAIKNQYRGWNGTTADHDYNWHDAIHDSTGNPCGNDATQPCDDYGHGTHTIGTVVGDDGAGNQIGMAPGAEWIACRNMDNGAGTPARYLECFEFFLAPYPIGGTPAQGDPSKAPDVTNNSWGCPPSEGCSWDTLQSAVEAQRAAGIMTVVSAGNSGLSCGSVADPPAIYDASYSVGATDSSDNLASFSSRGPASNNQDNPNLGKPDIVAPGVDVRSCVPGGGYQSWQGTSMAGPHVAGAVALVWSARPDLKNDQTATESLLNGAAYRLPGIVEGCGGDYVNGPNNSWGYGLVDVKEALTEDITLEATDLAVTETSGNGNGVLEAGEVFSLSPSWHNPGTLPVPSVTGSASMETGILPAKTTAGYGSIAGGTTVSCTELNDCYSARVASTRPPGHLDRTVVETLSSGETHTWTLHIGESFTDVPVGAWAYDFIETLFHNGITAGCETDLYCPDAHVSRWQMAVFIATSMAGDATVPSVGTVPDMGPYDCSEGGQSVFGDVPPTDSGCKFIHYIAAKGVTAGCGNGDYCPWDNVSRWQMAVFMAKAMVGDNPIPTSGTVPGMGDYDCSEGGQSVFGDVPPTDDGCPSIHYIAAQGVTVGCGGGNYCPDDQVSRAEMAVFLTKGFDLLLYGP